LTEALAAPLIESIRNEYDSKLRQKDEVLTNKETEFRQKELALAESARQVREREAQLARETSDVETQRALLDAEVARRTQIALERELPERLVVERKAIAESEERRLSVRFAEEMAERDRDGKEQAERIERLTAKLTAAQKAEADLRRREREFEDRERELKLTVEKELSGQLEQVRAVAASEVEERFSLQLSEMERKNRDLAKQLEEASRKAQQGSQQSQGETLELVLEDRLLRQFPFDEFQPVPKGEFGGDTLQVVRDSTGRECGRILWEFKRTKTWQQAWLAKLRNDQRAAKAHLAVIVTQAMPAEVQHFNELDGVWVSSLACALPVAAAMRMSLVQLASQRRNSEGQQTKSELVYAYLMGTQFSGRIRAIAERWTEMQKDLADEKKSTLKRWSKRELQLHTLIESTAGIYGDIQGIAGRDLAEIEALGETLLLEDGA